MPLGKAASYKYLVVKKSSGEVAFWEERQDNRVCVPTGLRHVIEDDAGAYRQAVIFQGLWGDHKVDDPKHDEKPSVVVPSDAAVPTPWYAASSKGGRSRANSIYPREGVEEDVEVSEEDTVFVVFRKLPFTVERVTGTSKAKADFRVVATDSDRHYFTVVSLIQQVHQEEPERNNFTMKFVGDPGIHTDNKEEQAAISKLLAPLGCIPVFVERTIAEQFLEFCNMFLWPVMHNTKVNKDDLAETEVEEAESRRLDEARWKSYKAVNTAYAEVLYAQCRKNPISAAGCLRRRYRGTRRR
jgi:hypothetical protein